MRYCFVILFCFVIAKLYAQDQQLSRLLEDQILASEGNEQEEDVQLLDGYLRKKLNINLATPEELAVFPFWNPLLSEQLVRYRKLLGNIEHVLELQAVPGFTPDIIRKLVPYITVIQQESLHESVLKSVQKADQMILVRTSLMTTNVDTSAFNPYMLLRYQLQSTHLSFGLLTEKDNGELFFQSPKGISFLSNYLSFQQFGRVKKLILGDYIVSIGQGLILWQGRPVRKTSLPMLIKREAMLLQPYRSTDENRFMRGIALEAKFGRLGIMGFISKNALDATIKEDTIQHIQYITAFSNTGLHRSESEIIGKNAVTVSSGGVVLNYASSRINIGYGIVQHHLSIPIFRDFVPYNLFALNGKHWVSQGVHYSNTNRNLHCFGEIALDGLSHWASVHGLLLSLDPKLDISLMYRKIDKGYRSFLSNAFTEGTEPNNEEGLYMGMIFKLDAKVSLGMYVDYYRFPWLRYGINKAGWGQDNMVIFTWKPAKLTEIYFRLKKEQKVANISSELVMLPVGLVKTTSGRFHVEHQFSLQTSWRMRMEFSHYSVDGINSAGMVSYTDFFWKWPKRSIQFNGRVMLFDTMDYNSRIYAFENDLAFSSSIPSFYGRGIKTYINCRIGIAKRYNIYLKYAFMNKSEEISNTTRAELVYRF